MSSKVTKRVTKSETTKKSTRKSSKKTKDIGYVLYLNGKPIASADSKEDSLLVKFQEQLKELYPDMEQEIVEKEKTWLNMTYFLDKNLIEKEGIVQPKRYWDLLSNDFDAPFRQYQNMLRDLEELPQNEEEQSKVDSVVEIIKSRMEQIKLDYQAAVKNPKYIDYNKQLKYM